MKIFIDNVEFLTEEGQSLFEILGFKELFRSNRKRYPVAAVLNKRTVSLWYVPEKNESFTLVYSDTTDGEAVLKRTTRFIFFAMLNRLYPKAKTTLKYTVSGAEHYAITGADESYDKLIRSLNAEMQRFINSETPIMPKTLTLERAAELFLREGQTDKLSLLEWRNEPQITLYNANDYYDELYGVIAPLSVCAQPYSLVKLVGALALFYKDELAAESSNKKASRKLIDVFSKGERWGELMTCSNIAELNRRVENGTVRELIRVNEALHEKEYAIIADKIIKKSARVVLVAGPSSSGKTTSANRIATQLRAAGYDPAMLSLDDYYADRDSIPRDENGELDLEHINTLDIPRFNDDISALLSGKEVEIPRFDFMTGKRHKQGKLLKIGRGQPMIIEGIHGLNPMLLGGKIDNNEVFRVYICAVSTINVDAHTYIGATKLRLLRRMVRDYLTRNASVELTYSMWPSVRRGEKRWIYPYIETADAVFNTSLAYELSVLKKYAYPLMQKLKEDDIYYMEAKQMLELLALVADANVEDEIPPTSILREFIGGNSFYREG